MQKESEQLKSKYNFSEIFTDLNVELFTLVSNATKSAIEQSQNQPNSAEITKEHVETLLKTFPAPSDNEVKGNKKSQSSEIISSFIVNEYSKFINETKEMIDKVCKEFLTRQNNIDPKRENAMIKELTKRFEEIINKKSKCSENASFLEQQLYKNFNEFKKNLLGKAKNLYNPTSPINDLYQRTLAEMSKTRDVLLPADRAEEFVTKHYRSNTLIVIQEYLHNLAKEFEQDNKVPETRAETTDNINDSKESGQDNKAPAIPAETTDSINASKESGQDNKAPAILAETADSINASKESGQDNKAPATLAQTIDNINASFATRFQALNSFKDNDPKKQIAVDLVIQARQTASSIVSAHYTQTHPTPKAESRRGSGIFSSPSSKRGSGILSNPSTSQRNRSIPSVFKKATAKLLQVKRSEDSKKEKDPPTSSVQNN